MGKRNGVEHRRRELLQRTGRDRLVSRVPGRDKERLRGVPSEGWGDVPGARQATKKAARLKDGDTNWLVRRERGTVVAVEPGQDHEHTFDGGIDPYGEALKYAARQLRKEHRERHTDVA